MWDTITHDVGPLLALTRAVLEELGDPLDE
ncbi:MAG: hypothetical protein ACE37H_06990 [Phycisphaeraceae bacterium]